MSTVFKDVETFLRAVGQEIPMHKTIVETPQSNLYKKLIDEEYSEFIDAWNENDDTEKLDACFDMIWVIVGYMKSRGWDCDASWVEGAASNLSKIDPDTGLVRRREDGKILKPENWKEPNFAQFVRENA